MASPHLMLALGARVIQNRTGCSLLRAALGCGCRRQEEAMRATKGKRHTVVGQTQLLRSGREQKDQATETGHQEAGTARLSAGQIGRRWQESCPSGQRPASGGPPWWPSLPAAVQAAFGPAARSFRTPRPRLTLRGRLDGGAGADPPCVGAVDNGMDSVRAGASSRRVAETQLPTRGTAVAFRSHANTESRES
jgi:hypothetical protein